MIQNYPGRFEYIWTLNDDKELQGYQHENVTAVRMRSLKFYYMKATSKVCVCNAGSFPELPLRKSQFQINTHHGGGAYKTAGAAIKGANSKTNLKKLQWDAENTSIYLSSSRYFTEEVVRKQKCFAGEVYEYGMPRNDVIIKNQEQLFREKVYKNKAELDVLADKVVYTGPIDAYFDYKLGTLEYRSVRFENELLDKPSFQGNAAVNYTDRETPWTRIIEHKWFEFGKDENGNDLPKTIISREYSSEWKPGDEPYYPVNDAKNSALYAEYKKLADAEDSVIFGGRLGEYKYYDMDQVIAAVLDKCEKKL